MHKALFGINNIEVGKTQMISKEQFLTIKRMKSDGVAAAAIARKVGVSEPVVREWARMDEAGFDALKRNDIPTWISTGSLSSVSCVFVRKPEKPTFCTGCLTYLFS